MYNILALSSSRSGNSSYLQNAIPLIEETLGSSKQTIAFIPFASVDNDHNNYLLKVQEALSKLPYHIQLVLEDNGKETILGSDAIMVGGGNTFKLLHDIYKLELFDAIKNKVATGYPYIGWSAGSNITGLSISTTNDMPIIQPKSFTAFRFLPFQINPHYINQKEEGFHGETRDQRLEEFIKLNPGIPVIGLPEGTALQLKGEVLRYQGNIPGPIFFSKDGEIERMEVREANDLSFLMKQSQ